MSIPETCPSCGMRVEPGAERCHGCGVDLTEPKDFLLDTDEQVPQEAQASPAQPSSDRRFCEQCGTPTSAEANFCSACGHKLRPGLAVHPPISTEPLPADAQAPTPAPAGKASRQVAYLVGLSLVAVAVLFGITVWSQQNFSTGDPIDTEVTPPTGSAPALAAPVEQPLDPDLQARTDALVAEIEETDDANLKLAKQRELVEVLVEAGRLDRAGDAQSEIAETVNTAESWARAGHLYYDWMEQQEGAALVATAKQAIAAYQQSLELDPDNLDVRTDMAIAYLNDPDNPMQAIQETNKVLEANPEHPQANFNKAVMLALIGRFDEALEQYDRVQEISEPGSYIYTQAETRKAQLRSALGQDGG